jgi:hypothetical protein
MKIQQHDWRVKILEEDTILILPRPKSKRMLNKLQKYATKLRQKNISNLFFYINSTSLNDIRFGIKIHWMLYEEKTKETPSQPPFPLIGNIDLFKE